MSLTSPSERRILPVRLSQVKLEVRVAAARRASRLAPMDAEALLSAALWPSETTYWVAPEARYLLDTVAA